MGNPYPQLDSETGPVAAPPSFVHNFHDIVRRSPTSRMPLIGRKSRIRDRLIFDNYWAEEAIRKRRDRWESLAAIIAETGAPAMSKVCPRFAEISAGQPGDVGEDP